jgi:hypothetical protein
MDTPRTKAKSTMDMHMHIAHIVETLALTLCGYLTSIIVTQHLVQYSFYAMMNLRSGHPTRWSYYPLVCPP